MNEDLKPIYDFKEDWTLVTPIHRNQNGPAVLIYENKNLESLFRLIDLKGESIKFSDVERVCKIKDINKILTKSDNEEENKSRFQAIINMVIDEIKPIEMPYVPEKLTCFIENFPGFDKNYDDTLGILYFREEKEDGNMIEAKRFFKINPEGTFPKYEELSREQYDDVKVKWYRRCEKNDNT